MVMSQFDFSVEQIWRDYWSKDLFQSPKSEEHNKENEVSTSDQEQPQSQIKKASSTTVSAATAGTGMSVKRQKIPVEELASLLQSPDLQNFVQEADYALYQYIVDILLPKVSVPFLKNDHFVKLVAQCPKIDNKSYNFRALKKSISKG